MWLRRRDWQDSEAHLQLLTKFCDGDSPVTYADSEDWESALGEQPQKAIERLRDESMLQPAGLPRLLDHNFTVAELKGMLREKGIKVSGRKVEIIQRLIDFDASGMRAVTKDATVYECTIQGVRLAETYLKGQRERRLVAERESLAMLVKDDFVEAARVMSHYEAAQVFPRGMGIDWSNYDEKPMVDSLRVIFGTPPGVLEKMNARGLGQLRVAAGMIQLWGTRDAQYWLPDGYKTGIRLDADAAARMLCFHATHIKRMESFKDPDLEGFVAAVEISGIDDGRHCAECSQIDGKKYNLAQVPELPFAKCTSEIGCRCIVIPVTIID